MKSIPGVHILPIRYKMNGAVRTIYPTLLRDGSSLILVDTGFTGQLPLFRKEMEAQGLNVERISSIIITHLDRDHIGGLPEFVQLLGPRTEVFSHEIERPYIQGDVSFTKKAPPGQTDHKLDFDKRSGVVVTGALRDGDRLRELGGITVVHTPGHTLGHVCIYLEKLKILITGDALNVIDGKLSGPNPDYTHDLPQAFQSLESLTKLDVQSVISYHGGYWEGDFQEALQEILQGELIDA